MKPEKTTHIVRSVPFHKIFIQYVVRAFNVIGIFFALSAVAIKYSIYCKAVENPNRRFPSDKVPSFFSEFMFSLLILLLFLVLPVVQKNCASLTVNKLGYALVGLISIVGIFCFGVICLLLTINNFTTTGQTSSVHGEWVFFVFAGCMLFGFLYYCKLFICCLCKLIKAFRFR